MDELKDWIKFAQKRWIYEDVERQWKGHDLNEDGLVSWEEYKNATYGYVLGRSLLSGGKSLVEPAPWNVTVLSCRMIVDKIDADKDGFVTEGELKSWIKHAQKKYIYDNVENQWQEFDLNQDGLISWDEYRNVTYGTYLGKVSAWWRPWSWVKETNGSSSEGKEEIMLILVFCADSPSLY